MNNKKTVTATLMKRDSLLCHRDWQTTVSFSGRPAEYRRFVMIEQSGLIAHSGFGVYQITKHITCNQIGYEIDGPLFNSNLSSAAV